MDLLRHLRYFVAVAEELHFGRAADRLHIAQSPLSQRVRALEEAMGVELLVRTTRSVELTPAGAVLLGEARVILGRVERMENVMADVRGGHLATLRVSFPHGVPPSVLAALISALEHRHAGVVVRASELTDTEQRTGLVDRRLDVGILRWPAPGVVRHGAPVGRELGVLLADDDPLLADERVELGALPSTRPVILPPRAAGAEQHDALLRTCFAHGYEPVEVLAAQSTEFAAARSSPPAPWRSSNGAPSQCRGPPGDRSSGPSSRSPSSPGVSTIGARSSVPRPTCSERRCSTAGSGSPPMAPRTR